MLGRGIIVGSVGVLVRPIAKGLSSSITKAFAGSSGAARKAGKQAGQAFADPVAAEGGKLPGRALGPLRSRAAAEAGAAGNSAGSSFISRVVSGIGSAAGAVASTLGRVLKGGAVVGGTAAIAGLGYTLSKGFGRLTAIENAESKLTGLGHSAKDVQSIMDNALTSVKGTSYGMDEAATTAASAVAAGIEPGQELEKYLGLVGDAAAIAGTDMASMGSIFNKVATSGKVQGDVFAQLGDQGIPIVQLLAEEMGVSAEEVYKLGSEGKISSEMFLQAMSSMEGAALEAGNTTSGALKNAGAAISRLGATLLGGFYPMIGQIARRFTELVDVVEEKVGPIIGAIMDRFAGPATAGIDAFFDTLIGWVENFNPEPMIAFFERIAGIAKAAFTEITGGIRAFGAAWAANDGDITSSGFPGFMERVAYIARTTFDEIKGGITAFGAAWSYNDGEITSSGFPGFMERAGYLVRQLWDAVKQLDFTSFSGFASSISSAFGTIGSSDALAGVGGAISQIAGAAPALLGAAIRGLGSAFEFLGRHADTIVKLLPLIIAGFVAFRAHSKMTANALITQRMLTASMAPVMLANNAIILVNNLLERQSARAKAASTAATNAQAASTTRATIAERARTIATKAGAIASKVAAGATRLLGAAIRFATGPIGLIITGITLLAAGLVYFFTKTETGQQLWTRIWGAIQGAVAGVVDWFQTTALPFLQAAWDGIAAGALWLYHSAILPAWGGIQTAVQAVGDWITGTLWPALQTAWDAIGAAAMWLYQNVILPAWTGIRIAIAVAITAVLVYIDLLKWWFTSVIAPAAMWLWNNVMVPAWNGIKAVIGAVAGWIMNVAWPLIKQAWDAISAAAVWLWHNVMVPVWNGIKAAIGAVAGWIMNVAWPLIKRAWDAIAGAAMWLWNSVLKPAWAGIRAAISAVVDWLVAAAKPIIEWVVDKIGKYFGALKTTLGIYWNAIKWAISTVVTWLRDTAWPLIQRVIDWIKNAFNVMRDSLKAAWRFVRYNVINPVVTWLRDVAWGGIIKPAIEAIKTGFNGLRDGIKAAWKAIQDKAIKPVVSWLTDTVKPKIDRLTDNIKSGFETMRDGILEAWDKIKEGLKSPINGIIRIYNKHVKGNFDNVAEKLGLKTTLPEMNEFHTGGYTGRGPKYKPAGIVHADEYVIRKESQNDLARRAPGFLDSLNRLGSKALGYAAGGLVKLRMPFAGSYPRGDGFGARGGKHEGIDWPMPSGAVLKAVAAGTVKHRRNPAAGKKLELSIGNGLIAGYHHLSSFIAKAGSSVGRGADIARVGSTGRSSGPHLHFSLKRDGKYVDPAPYLGAGGEAGEGGGGWWNPFDGLWSRIKDKVKEAVGGGMVGDILTKTASNSIGWVKDWVTDKITAVGDWGMEQVDGAVQGVKSTRWLPVATQALSMEGMFSTGNLNALMRRMNQESGFNPRAENNWDSNAKRGTPSRGLMQVIGPTFRAHARPGYDKDIFDPLSNILASIRYTRSRYSSLQAGWNRPGGYADGGLVTPPTLFDSGGVLPPGLTTVLNASRKPEAVLTNDQLKQLRIIASRPSERGGDTFIGNGYTPEQIARAWRVEEKKREALYTR